MSSSPSFPRMTFSPHEMCDKIDKLIKWERVVRDQTANKVQLLQAIHLLEEHPPQEESRVQIEKLRAQCAVADSEVNSAAAGCERIFQSLGPQFREELEQINPKDEMAALQVMQRRYLSYKKEYDQVAADIWRSAMWVVPKKGAPVLISQSSSIVQNWQKMGGTPGEFAYDAKDVAQDQQLEIHGSILEEMRHKQMQDLDWYLDQQGLSLSEKQQVYKVFHQQLLAHVTPEQAQEKFMKKARDQRLSNEERLRNYHFAAWAIGRVAPDPITPGSDMDTNGFADYLNSNVHPVEITKSFAFCLDLKKHEVIGYYLLEFENPSSKQKEQHCYKVTQDYVKGTSKVKEVKPRDFPNLEKTIHYGRLPSQIGPQR